MGQIHKNVGFVRERGGVIKGTIESCLLKLVRRTNVRTDDEPEPRLDSDSVLKVLAMPL